MSRTRDEKHAEGKSDATHNAIVYDNICDVCNNYMLSNEQLDSFRFHCVACNVERELSDEASLRFEEKKNTNPLVYKTIARNLKDDPAAEKVLRMCPYCHTHSYMRKTRLNENLRVRVACMTCGGISFDDKLSNK